MTLKGLLRTLGIGLLYGLLLTINHNEDIFNYVLTGSGNRIKIIDVINDTSNWFMTYKDTHWMDNAFLNETPPKSSPTFYNFNGVDY